MKRRRIIGIVVVALAAAMLLQLVVSFVGVGLFYHFFYARYDVFCPTDLKESDLAAVHTPVTFSSDGNTLSGLFIGEGEKGVIVMIHGMRSGMDAHFAEADYFAAHGYTVFTYDGTGTRTSGGRSRRSVSFARDDLNAALDWLETTSLSGLPVFLYGHSSGGYAAATVLDRVDAAAALCAFDDPIDTMCDTAEQYISALVYLQRPLLALWNRIEAGADANESAGACINRSSVPILIVGASGDTVIPEQDALYHHADAITDPNAEYLERTGNHSDIWLSEDALDYRMRTQNDAPESIDKTQYNAIDPDLLDTVLAFFDSAL